MTIRTWLIASLGLVSLNLTVPFPADANLLDDVSNASVGVLKQLGYNCKTASAGAILCTKCKADGIKQKCEAFTCDVATKKCRRKTAEIPNIPGLNNDADEDSNDGVNLPSL